MNFERLKSKLKDSASKAAEAAKSFKGFDDMAANDDYIHTEGLNVKRKNRTDALELTANSSSATHEEEEEEKALSLSLSSRSGVPYSTPPPRQSTPRQSSVPLLTIVKTALSDHSRNPRHGHPSDEEDDGEESLYNNTRTSNNNHFLDMESIENGGEVTDDEDDPILQRMQPQGKRKGRKNVNRFMEDLEQRVSATLREDESNSQPENVPLITTSTTSTTKGTDEQPKGWLGWPLRLRTDNTENVAASAVAPLAKPKRERHNYKQATSTAEPETFEVVTSTAMLDDADMQELAQLQQRQQQQQSTLIEKIWMFYQAHPRECFIGFTLLLGAMAYFHSRRETVEDDVTFL